MISDEHPFVNKYPFIPNVPKIYISDPCELEIAMQLWEVGQGGVSDINPPRLIGRVYAIDCYCGITGRPPQKPLEISKNFFVLKDTVGYISYSYRDHHLLPQEYNNLYVCDSLAKAKEIFKFMKNLYP